jgi:anti-sigma B factor antagonist
MASLEGVSPSVFIIQLEGEFDLAERDRVKDAFAVAQSSPIVVVNLQKALYIDSTVLGCLVEFYKTIEQRGARLYLVGPSPNVVKILEIASLRDFFDVLPSLSNLPDVDSAEIRWLTIESRPL